jgi:SPP1 family predicted phage head-tail adaptor
MEYSEIIYLLKESIEEDEIGNITSSSNLFSKKITEINKNLYGNKCYAKKQSVKTKEFYNAVEIGKSPTCEFVVKKLNYNNENYLEWNNEIYSIIRTVDPKNKFDIVLVCERKIGINGK